MSYVYIVLTFIGGIGMFLYGMHIMAEGLQKSVGAKMKRLLGLLTTKKIYGVFVGTVVTGIIQSSTATTVMVVGFCNAGLMNLSQAFGVIMGANIGTTATSWLVASMEWAEFLNPVTLAPLAVGIGAFMLLFAKKDITKQIGEIIVGFGILFVGMEAMTTAFEPFADSPIFKEAFVLLGSNPILGILAGAVITAVIQSSTASVGILQSLALSGLVPFNAGVYIIMGQNIGTCGTALISSIGTSKNARAAAYIHLMVNVIGSVVFAVVAIFFFQFIDNSIGNSLITVTGISAVHTAFNVFSAIALYPFGDQFIAIAEKMSVSKKLESDEGEPAHLDDRILETPSFAIQSCVQELVRMGNMALENLEAATAALLERDQEKVERVMRREKSIDMLDEAITNYLVKLCNVPINEAQNRIITSFFHTVNDIERVGDHCENIVELAEQAIADDISFSEAAYNEIKEIIALTVKSFGDSITALDKGSLELARSVVADEEGVDILETQLRNNHIKRLSNNECTARAGVIYLDALTNLERISDHALNIAQGIMGEKTPKL